MLHPRGRTSTPRVALLLALAACAADLDEDLEDAERTSAIEIPLNRVVVDSLDADGGDTRDWKFFSVPADGLVTLTVGFDLESTQPAVEMTNAVGQVLSDLDVPDSTVGVRRLSIQAEPGNYYLHLSCARGSTDYSVEVLFEPRGENTLPTPE